MAGYITYNGVSIRWFPNASGDGRADIKVDGGFVSFDTLRDAKVWIDAGQHIDGMTVHAL
jgi:hypothetical protein